MFPLAAKSLSPPPRHRTTRYPSPLPLRFCGNCTLALSVRAKVRRKATRLFPSLFIWGHRGSMVPPWQARLFFSPAFLKTSGDRMRPATKSSSAFILHLLLSDEMGLGLSWPNLLEHSSPVFAPETNSSCCLCLTLSL